MNSTLVIIGLLRSYEISAHEMLLPVFSDQPVYFLSKVQYSAVLQSTVLAGMHIYCTRVVLYPFLPQSHIMGLYPLLMGTKSHFVKTVHRPIPTSILQNGSRNGSVYKLVLDDVHGRKLLTIHPEWRILIC